MKIEILLSVLLFTSATASAQNSIDLSKVDIPAIKYLELGIEDPLEKRSV